MTALAGVCDAGSPTEAAALAEAVLDAQSDVGPHDRVLRSIGSSAIGRRLYRLLPEDAHDAGPLIDGDLGLVADARIDNRDELGSLLGLGSLAAVSDARIVFQAYRRWGVDLVDHVIGDYAIAAWNERLRELILIRDVSGQRPLHYHLGAGWAAFSTMPYALAALPGMSARIDADMVSEFVADLPRRGAPSYYRDVRRVEPGQIVTIRNGTAQTRPYWRMPSRELRLPSADQYVEAYREQLDRAVDARLRGAGATVGSHLSGGLDSSSIASTAARILGSRNGKVVAFTSAPREGFTGPAFRDRIADEAALAGLVAARYANMEHAVVRSGTTAPFAVTARDGDRYAEPIGLPCNQVWWSAIHDAARDRGLSVLLTGEAGNYGASAGSVATLSEFVRRGRPVAWARAAGSLLGRGPRLRGLLHASFAPFMPASAWRWLDRRTFGEDARDATVPLLRPAHRERLLSRVGGESRRAQPTRSEYGQRWNSIAGLDPGDFRKGILAGWGLDERDPTSDRRFLEFCFSLPPEQLIGEGMTRRLARRALADRVPAEVLHGPRGYQGADWYERVDPLALACAIDDLRARPGIETSVVDPDRLADVARAWPQTGWAQGGTIQAYRIGLLRAMAAAHFEAAVARRAGPSPALAQPEGAVYADGMTLGYETR